MLQKIISSKFLNGKSGFIVLAICGTLRKSAAIDYFIPSLITLLS